MTKCLYGFPVAIVLVAMGLVSARSEVPPAALVVQEQTWVEVDGTVYGAKPEKFKLARTTGARLCTYTSFGQTGCRARASTSPQTDSSRCERKEYVTSLGGRRPRATLATSCGSRPCAALCPPDCKGVQNKSLRKQKRDKNLRQWAVLDSN